jgi:inner membrane protein
VCNNYGTGLLEPFSHQRFSLHLLYVVDPLFSLAPAVAALLLLKKSLPPVRRRLWMAAFAWCAIYCGIAAFNKQSLSNILRQSLQQQGLPQQRMLITPSPLNTLLWYAVAGNDSGYHVTFRSVLDADSSKIAWQYFPSNRHWLDTIADHEDLQHLIRFSQEFYTVEKWGDSLVFNDLRFGQMLGWQQPRGRFVFHYYLQHPTENDMIVQRGRFKGWNKKVALALLRRMLGQR